MESKDELIQEPKNNQISAVEKYKVVNDVLELYKKGMPAYKISEWLIKNKDVKISHVSISKWLRKNKILMKKKIATDLRSFDKFEKMCVNYEKEIKSVLTEVKEMKDIAKNDREVDDYVKLVGKLFQGLELLAKLMGDLKPSGNIDINIIIDKISEDSHAKFKGNRKKLFLNEIIDVEAEILKTDFEREIELNGEGKEQ